MNSYVNKQTRCDWETGTKARQINAGGIWKTQWSVVLTATFPCTWSRLPWCVRPACNPRHTYVRRTSRIYVRRTSGTRQEYVWQPSNIEGGEGGGDNWGMLPQCVGQTNYWLIFVTFLLATVILTRLISLNYAGHHNCVSIDSPNAVPVACWPHHTKILATPLDTKHGY